MAEFGNLNSGKQSERKNEKRICQRTIKPVWDMPANYQGDNPQQCVNRLPSQKKVIGSKPFQRKSGTRAVNHYDTDAHQKKYRKKQFNVIRNERRFVSGTGHQFFHFNLSTASQKFSPRSA